MNKILAIRFKYLGDVAVTIPALRAIVEKLPDAELHVVVAEEAVPLLRHLPWIDRLWAFPRARGKARLRRSLPLIRKLRRERFDISIDFSGNDRGAILSLLAGAKLRAGPIAPRGFWGRKHCYNCPVEELPYYHHELIRNFHLVTFLGIAIPEKPQLEMRSDPALAEKAQALMGGHEYICHLSTSRKKKEWPLDNWIQFYRKAAATGAKLVFSSGPSEREQSLLETLVGMDPSLPILPLTESLDLFLAVLQEARGFISGDTGPLHFAAGLGVPTIGMFGPTDSGRWAPPGSVHQSAQGGFCPCSGHASSCRYEKPCIEKISPDQIFECFQKMRNMEE